MLVDLHDFDEGVTLDCDLCIVGGGIAGITLARQLADSNREVCLLESGGLDFEAETQALYEGRNLGLEYYPLGDSRLRFFGGSTLVWGGRCVPLDPMDFAERPWVPHSGWPLSRADLDPYYRRAQFELGLGPFVYDERVWRALGAKPAPFSPDVLQTTFWQIDELHSRFAWESCKDLERARNIRVVVHANVTNIQANAGGSAVSWLDISTLEGRRGRVRARAFVLAAGGIENPRLLLASNGVHSRGLGNRNDLVGRFFMEHPHGRAAEIVTRDPHRLLSMFRKRRTEAGALVDPVLSPSEELQRSARILNTSVTLRLRRRAEAGVPLARQLYQAIKQRSSPTTSRRRAWRVLKRIKTLFHEFDPGIRRAALALGTHRLYLMVRGEQAPNRQSRVRLSTLRDALGVPRADLDWRMSRLDKQSVARLVEALGKELERLGLGRVVPSDWLWDGSDAWPVDPTVGTHPIGGYHHMGTTRMSDDPKHGVVDAQCRVFGLRNLYVAGSSVFPTAGWANPNLTIVALTLRLAEHLAR